MRIAVVYGGISSEREISLKSGNNVIAALEKLDIEVLPFDLKRSNIGELLTLKADLFFISLHGQYGEDGSIQGFMELAGLPYTCSDVRVSSLCFDKETTYKLVDDLVDLPLWRSVRSTDDLVGWDIFPCIIKPAREGSSIGISVCDTIESLIDNAGKALRKYDLILLEEFIEGRELTVSILDMESGSKVLPILEILPKNRFYDYEAKYTAGLTEFAVPAPLELELEHSIKKKALEIYACLGCRDMARIDGILKGNKFYFLEVNTIPGLTDLSDLPMSARAMGMSFEQTIACIVNAAIRRTRR